MQFDSIADRLNEWIQENGYHGYYIDDVIEQDQLIQKDQFPDNTLDLTNFKFI